jgi:amidophosphoribosyltransferase
VAGDGKDVLGTDEPRHHCGVAALCRLRKGTQVPDHAPETCARASVAPLMPRLLMDLQNRGQLSAGLASFCPDRPHLLKVHVENGSVMEVFRLSHPAKAESLMRDFAATAAVGHTRYATCGPDETTHAQPFEYRHGRRWKWFTFAFNGNLANYQDLKRRLLAKTDYHIVREGDTEILMHFLAFAMRGTRRRSLAAVFRQLARRFDGAYNVALLNAQGDLAVARDPLGLRPMCYAVGDDLFAAASESIALANIGFTDVRSLPPGHVLAVERDDDGRAALRLERFAPSPRHAHCFFEWVYFANPASVLDGRSVYLVRTNLGRELAAAEDLSVDHQTVVVPVPDTAKPIGDAYAFARGLPSVEGLLRNRYVGRTFILGVGRAERAQMKYTPLPEVVGGKRVILVEDSLVRCTTLQALLNQMRTRGRAREVHVRIACPPIIAPCFYGIDMSTVGELFAPRYIRRTTTGRLPSAITDRMARDIGADSLRYLPVEAIPRAVGFRAEELCLACITGKYPTPWGNRLYRAARRAAGKTGQGRTYEAVE